MSNDVPAVSGPFKNEATVGDYGTNPSRFPFSYDCHTKVGASERGLFGDVREFMHECSSGLWFAKIFFSSRFVSSDDARWVIRVNCENEEDAVALAMRFPRETD